MHIPDDWLWLPLSDLGAVRGGLTKNAKRGILPRKASYLRVANVYADRLELGDVAEIGVTEEEFERTRLGKGDLLFVEGNGSVDQIGRVAEWDGSIRDVTHQNHLIRFTAERTVLARYALQFMQSPLGRKAVVAQASSTSGLHTLSISKIEALPIPLCSPAEQAEIVRILDARLSAADALSAEIDAGLRRADALRQSILTAAFSGRLVPQDPADEPVAALLARIRAARAAAPKPARRKRKATA
jgi:type I restriction enzyme S subunit